MAMAMAMAMDTSVNGVIVSIMLLYALHNGSCDESVPGIYIFGDSLVDIGNNNYISGSMVKADFPHNDLDFPTGNATGRFSNGKNAADFLAENVGLPTPPPYLSLVSENKTLGSTNTTVTGVSFASGGAGILNGTHEIYESIPLGQQVEYYSLVHEQVVQQLGSAAAQAHLANSLFGIVIGSNDIFAYFGSSNASQIYTPQQYVDLMASTFKQHMKRLYGLGAHKFIVVGVGMIGCCPTLRIHNTTYGCLERMNYWTTKYNQGLELLLNELKMESSDINYTYFDTYETMSNIMQHPDAYGISNVKEACCGLGDLNAAFPCIPISDYCSNRQDHLFWDIYHPTEKVSHMFADLLYNGSLPFTLGMNVQQLTTM